MITLEISGAPIPFSHHQGFGRRAYNPKFKEKQYCQWQIQSQFNRKAPIQGPLIVSVAFHMPIPKGTSKPRTRQMLNGVMHHIKRPDVDNLQKFILDCLKTIVFEDDSQIFEIHAKKIFSETPKTIIQIGEVEVSRLL